VVVVGAAITRISIPHLHVVNHVEFGSIGPLGWYAPSDPTWLGGPPPNTTAECAHTVGTSWG
jgi:hypothetical protein